MARPKGSPNKVTMDALKKAQELGIDPFVVLLHFANEDWEALGYGSPTMTKVLKDGGTIEVDRIPPELRMAAARDAVQYMLPKRKSVEHSLKDVPDEVFDQEVERRTNLKILNGGKVG